MNPELAAFDNTWYQTGGSTFKRMLWFFFGLPVLRSSVLPFSRVRAFLLQAFGAQIGAGVVIKPGVRVKYPWLLSVGNNSWIGEDVWIDNLASVTIGDDVCISQAAYLCTGNHDWADPSFGLITQPIVVGNGCWVGARSVICPGVTLFECGVTAAGSVVAKNVPAFQIYAGNPAALARRRDIRAPHAYPPA